MNPEIEPLERDAGDSRMKFRIGESMTGRISLIAECLDAEEALVLERLIFEGLYSSLCRRCGERNPGSARFCQRCGMEVEKDEEAPEVVNLTEKKVLVVDE